ncbi:PRC-barrel domain-containing protein [Noviherbaspirillum saxi]|uniref:PRC-barrel domain containing protein n=1 Tax=Noviherbaspirillum saxi TaxID=2320863 RepID=A0A3A3FSB1_9BURK|nr:PRC-barrel domain-containing protein [Noviherbaspirillum saxi]RJF99107.1 PRC-barrel domain containing protein [Noviherbaspirillum saxi]
MKSSISAFALAALLPLAAQAAPASSDANPPATTRTAKSAEYNQLYRGSKIIGTSVRDPKDKKVGTIQDLILDSGRGEIAYAVISFGGVMGVGRKFHAVPWQALEPNDDNRHYVLHADRETITQAPGFDKARWPDMTDEKWSAEIDRYWSRMVGRGTFGTNKLTSGATNPAPSSATTAPPAGTGTGPRSDMQNSGR